MIFYALSFMVSLRLMIPTFSAVKLLPHLMVDQKYIYNIKNAASPKLISIKKNRVHLSIL